MSPVRTSLFAVSLALISAAAAADEVVGDAGIVRTGSLRYLVAGVRAAGDSIVAWPSVTKITTSAGKVLFERTAPAGPSPPGAGEIRGNAYVNEKLGLTLDIPANKDVTATVERTSASSLTARAMVRQFLFEADIQFDETAIKNKATAQAFGHDFPNRLLLLVDPRFEGCKSDELLRRIASDEVDRYEASWARDDESAKDPPAHADSATLGGEKGFRARGSVTEKRNGGAASGKGGVGQVKVSSEVKRERVVEVTVVRHGSMLVAVIAEVTAPDDLVDGMLSRLRKIASTLRFSTR